MLDSLSNSCLKIGAEADEDMLETILKYCRATVFTVLVADALNILAPVVSGTQRQGSSYHKNMSNTNAAQYRFSEIVRIQQPGSFSC